MLQRWSGRTGAPVARSGEDGLGARGLLMAASMAAHNRRLLRYVLEDLRYPARWWEIMAMADPHPLAAANRAELAQLPRQL